MGTVSFTPGSGLDAITGLNKEHSDEDSGDLRLVHNPRTDSFSTTERSSFWGRCAKVFLASIALIVPGVLLYGKYKEEAEGIKQENRDAVDAFLLRMRGAFQKSGGDVNSPAFKQMAKKFRGEIEDGRSLTKAKAQEIYGAYQGLAKQQKSSVPDNVPVRDPIPQSDVRQVQQVEEIAPPKDMSWLEGQIDTAVNNLARERGIDPVRLTPGNRAQLREELFKEFETLTGRGRDEINPTDVGGQNFQAALGKAVKTFADDQQTKIRGGKYTSDLEFGFQLEKHDVLDKSKPMDDRMARSYHLLACGRSAVKELGKPVTPPSSSSVQSALGKASARIDRQGFPVPLMNDGSEDEGVFEGRFLKGFNSSGQDVRGRHDQEDYDSYHSLTNIGNDMADLHRVDGELGKLEEFCSQNADASEKELLGLLKADVQANRSKAGEKFDRIRDGLVERSKIFEVLDFRSLPRSIVEPLFLRDIPESAKTREGRPLREQLTKLLCDSYMRLPYHSETGERRASAPKEKQWDYGVGKYVIRLAGECADGLADLNSPLAGRVRGIALHAAELEGERAGMELLSGAMKTAKPGELLPEHVTVGPGEDLLVSRAVGRYCPDSGDVLLGAMGFHDEFAKAYADYQKEGSDEVLTPKKSSALRRMQDALLKLEKACGPGSAIAELSEGSPDSHVQSISESLIRLAEGCRKITTDAEKNMEKAQPLIPLSLPDVGHSRDKGQLLPHVKGKAVFAAATRESFLTEKSGRSVTGHEYIAHLKPRDTVIRAALRDVPEGRMSGNPSKPNTNDKDLLVVLGRGTPMSMESTGISREEWQVFEKVQKARAEKRTVSIDDARTAERVERALLPGVNLNRNMGISLPLSDGSSLTTRLASMVGKNQITQSFAEKLANQYGEARWPHEDKEQTAFLNNILQIAESGRPALASELLELYAPTPPSTSTPDTASARRFAEDAVKNPGSYTQERYKLLTD